MNPISKLQDYLDRFSYEEDCIRLSHDDPNGENCGYSYWADYRDHNSLTYKVDAKWMFENNEVIIDEGLITNHRDIEIPVEEYDFKKLRRRVEDFLRKGNDNLILDAAIRFHIKLN